MLPWLILILSSYLLGSIPCGFLLGRLKGVDVREYGSGKIGAANIYRALGIKAGVFTLLADLAKGFGAVLIAKALFHSPVAYITAALVAVIGHNWSIYLGFKGGRGVTTYFGGLIALYPPAGIITGLLTPLIMAISRYASLGSLLGSLSSIAFILPLTFMGKLPQELSVYVILGTALIFFRHRDNIARLLSGTERRLELKRNSKR
jgi:glycerol-3-phosphate acyltransferase PlsY